MPDIKIDEIDYNYFLNQVKVFVEKTDNLDSDMSMLKEELILYIDVELEIRSLMNERKRYFDAYESRKDKENPESKSFADVCYHKYKAADAEIRKLRKDRDRWKNAVKMQ